MGDRRLTAIRPPMFDNPITTGFVDDQTGALFSSDCFGALLPGLTENAADLDSSTLASGQIRWATIDSAWVYDVDRGAFDAKLHQLRAIQPSMVYSSHLPPAPGSMFDQFIESLAQVPDAPCFEGPDQAALEAMLAAIAPPSG